MLSGLKDLRGRFGRLGFAVESLSFLSPVRGDDGTDRLYVIRRGRVRAELEPPATSTQRTALDAVLDEIFGNTADGLQVPSHEIDELLLLSSWFRRFPRELDR